MTEDYKLQFFTGYDWYTTSNIYGGAKRSAGSMRLEMQDLQKIHPGKPIRIVDSNGRIVDML